MDDPQQISEVKVYDWFGYINEILGVLCFTASITALSFKNQSAEIATITLIFIVILSFSIGFNKDIRRHIERLERYKSSSQVSFLGFVKTPVFFIGFSVLVSVACGLNLSFIQGFSLQNLFFS